MKYSEKEIDLLRSEVGKRISEKRFNHTLGVEKMALKIGKACLPDRVDELRAAALLHDISKEYSEAGHFCLVKKYGIPMTEAEIGEPALWHSLTCVRTFPSMQPRIFYPPYITIRSARPI